MEAYLEQVKQLRLQKKPKKRRDGYGMQNDEDDERRDEVRVKIHDRRKYADCAILVDNKYDDGTWERLHYIPKHAVIRVYIDNTTFLLVVGDIVDVADYFTRRESKAYLSIAIDALPPDLLRLVQIAERAETLIRIEPIPPEMLTGKEGIQLDNIQLNFKEMYLSRADMWKMRKALIGKCLFQETDTVLQQLKVHLRINDMWSKGNEVKHGYVGSDTRVVFRSSSSMILIYVQVSHEMWKMEEDGQVYLEKCCHGFLKELFGLWQEHSCSHYVTVIMCSRWYFKRPPPIELQETVQTDHRQRYYRDFYKLIVQNEHYEDWTDIMPKVRSNFYRYENEVQDALRQEFPTMPYNNFEMSSAIDANFLELLNLSMNMYCLYHNDRRYETTGQHIIYITAGSGVFEVDEAAVNPTKQRLIDMGISLDMVCIGPQPLHLTPLFVFHNPLDQVYKYYIPHWMNYSYYRMKPIHSFGRFWPQLTLDDGDYAIRDTGTYPCDYNIREIIADDGVRMAASLKKEDRRLRITGDEEGDSQDDEEVMSCETSHEGTKIYMTSLLDAARTRSITTSAVEIEANRKKDRRISRLHKTNLNSPTFRNNKRQKDVKRISTGSSLTSLDPEISFDKKKYSDAEPRRLTIGTIATQTAEEEQMLKSDILSISQVIDRQRVKEVTELDKVLFSEEQPKPVPKAVQRLSSTTTLNLKERSNAVGKGGGSLESTKTFIPARVRESSGPIPRKASTARSTHHYPHQRNKVANASAEFPFQPDTKVDMTANRRRWIHVFPMDERGLSKLAHHFVQGRSIMHVVNTEEDGPNNNQSIAAQVGGLNESPLRRANSPQTRQPYGSPVRGGPNTSPYDDHGRHAPRYFAWAWGSTGEEKWDPDIVIGMDWKSLARSALLPITTDFFPDTLTIRNEYQVYSYQVLVERNQYPNPYNLPLSEISRLVFDQLICQRLQRGFQIVTLKRALIRSALEKAGWRNDNAEDEVTLAFNRIYHRLFRRSNDIHITLLVSKSENKDQRPPIVDKRFPEKVAPKYPPPPQAEDHCPDEIMYDKEPYDYYFKVPDAECYEKSRTNFVSHNLEKINWSLLDMNIRNRNFHKEIRYYKSRFMIVPQMSDPERAIHVLNDNIRGEDFIISPQEPHTLTTNFTKLMMNLNRLIYVRKEEELPPEEEYFVPLTAADPDQVFERFIGFCHCVPLAYRDDGLPTQVSQLPENTFLSIDLIDWLVKNVEHLTTKEKALDFVNRDCRVKPLKHTIVEPDENASTHSLDFDLSTIRYGFQLCNFVDFDQEPEEHETPPTRYMTIDYINACSSHGFKDDCLYKRADFDFDFSPRMLEIEPGKLVAVNDMNPLGEWGRLVYERGFTTSKAYELMLKWYVASGVTVGDAVRCWVTKAEECLFTMFPVPEDAFALPYDPLSNPLRCPIKIEIEKDIIPADRLLETMKRLLTSFGFVAMYCGKHGLSRKMDRNRFQEVYQAVHECGGMFVSVELGDWVGKAKDLEKPHPYIYWSWNHMLSHRYRGAVLNEVMEEFQDYMLREFREVVSNKDDRLQTFYERINWDKPPPRLFQSASNHHY
ncbi:unnamed protein product, partial [Mesorhabditis spiculigera]